MNQQWSEWLNRLTGDVDSRRVEVWPWLLAVVVGAVIGLVMDRLLWAVR